MRKTFLLYGLSLLIYSQAYTQSSLHDTSLEAKFQDALELFQKDQFSSSREAFDRLSLHPDVKNNSREVAIAYYRALSALHGDFPEGTSLMDAFILDYPNESLRNEAAWILGNDYFQSKNYKKAISNFDLLRNVPLSTERHPELFFKMGYSYFQLKNFSQAKAYFERAKTYRSPYLASAYFYAGYCSFEEGNFEAAAKDFKEAEKSSEYSLKVPYMLAGIYYRQNKLDTLIAYAAPIVNKTNLESSEQIHLLLAEAYYEKQNYAQAAFHYMGFVSANKGKLSRDQQYKAGVAHYENKQFAEASQFFKEVALVNDELGHLASYFLGYAYVQQKNLPFAANSFNAAYKMDFRPEIKEEALFNYAKVSLELGKFQEAITALDNYLNDYPQGSQKSAAENLLSDALVNTNNYLRAIGHMEKMNNKSRRIQEAYQKVTFYQAMTYYRDNNLKGTQQMLTKSLQFPVNKSIQFQAQFWKGEANAANNNTTAAIRAYEKLIGMNPPSMDPSLIRAHYGLGYAYFNEEQYGKAETQFKTYTDKLKNSSDKQHYEDAFVRLGDTYYIQKKFTDAANVFRRAVAENNQYSDYAYFRGGVVANFQNNNREAIRQLDMVINNYPNSLYMEDALYQKAQIHMEELNYSQARDVFTQLIRTKPNSPFIPFALEGRAVANYSLKDYDQAIEDYKMILDNYPNSENGETALVGLQESLSLQGRSQEFSTYLSGYRKSNPSNNNLQNVEFSAAKSLVFNQSYRDAIAALENYIRNYPNSAQVPEAKYYLGDANFRLGDKAKALAIFYQIENTSDNNLKSRVYQKIGQIEFENGNFTKSIPYYQFIAKNARSKAEEYEATYALMQAYFETRKYNEAIVNADKILELGSITIDSEPNALLVKAKSLENTNSQAQAIEVYRQLMESHKTIQGAEALYKMALNLHQKGEYARSNELIFDNSQPFTQYAYWYGKQFIVLAQNYIAMEEKFQAKATLESIIENATDDSVKKEAETLLQTINIAN